MHQSYNRGITPFSVLTKHTKNGTVYRFCTWISSNFSQGCLESSVESPVLILALAIPSHASHSSRISSILRQFGLISADRVIRMRHECRTCYYLLDQDPTSWCLSAARLSAKRDNASVISKDRRLTLWQSNPPYDKAHGVRRFSIYRIRLRQIRFLFFNWQLIRRTRWIAVN